MDILTRERTPTLRRLDIISRARVFLLSESLIYPLAIFLSSFLVKLVGIFTLPPLPIDGMFYVAIGKNYVRTFVEWIQDPQFEEVPPGFQANYMHPMVGKWIFGIATSVLPFEDLISARLVTIILTSLTCVLIYLIGKEVVGREFGLLASLISNFNGFFFYMNITTGLDPIATFFAFLCIYLYMKNHPLLSGISLGLTFATKYTSFILAPLLLLLLAFKERFNRQGLLQLFKVFLVGACVFFLVQPRFWFNPLERLKETWTIHTSALGAGHAIRFMGKTVSHAPIYFFIIVLLCRSTPIETIGFLLFFYYVIRRWGYITENLAILKGISKRAYTFTFSTFFVSTIVFGMLGKKMEGYSNIIFPIYFLFISVGLYELINRRFSAKWKRLAVVTTIGLLQLSLMVPYFSYTGVQYNLLLGKETVNWMIGVSHSEGIKETSEWMESNHPNSTVLVFGYGGVVAKYAPSLKVHDALYGEYWTKENVTEINPDFIYYHEIRDCGPLITYYLRNIKPIYTYHVWDVTTVYIWENIWKVEE